MLVILQFPLADLRRLTVAGPKVSLPSQPRTLGTSDGIVDSLRYFGWAEDRPAGADPAFPDEESFFSAHNALRFLHLGKNVFNRAGVEIERNIGSFRRLFIADNKVSARIEVGLRLSAIKRPLDFDSLIQLLGVVLDLPTGVRTSDLEIPKRSEELQFANGHLARQGKALACHYALATSGRNAKTATVRRATKLVRHCQPVVFVELQHGEFVPNEIAKNLPYFKRLDHGVTADVDVWYGQIQASDQRGVFPCWLLAPGAARPKTLRSLRLCLLRLHAEQKIIQETRRWLEQEPDRKTNTEILKSYLDFAQDKILDRIDRGKFGQSAIMAAIQAVTTIRPETESIRLNEWVDTALRKSSGQGRRAKPDSAGIDPTLRAWYQKLNNPPDLTVFIQKEPLSLFWSFFSRHCDLMPDLPLPTVPSRRPIEGSEEFAKVLSIAEEYDGGFGLYENIRGIGLKIGSQTPPELWHLINHISSKLGRKPTLLLISGDSLIPWELARENVESPFLGAMTVIGRWLLPEGRMANRWPPTEVHISLAALFAGKYAGKQSLPGAISEIKTISDQLADAAPTPQITNEQAQSHILLEYLKSRPVDHLIHFAVHGNFDPEHRQDGLITTDNKYISSFMVSNSILRGDPFVFLNACLIGRGRHVLGSAYGMAESFLEAGASGVLAPLWMIGDDEAGQIANAFYKLTLGTVKPNSVAEFIRARREEFDDHSTSLTRIAYKFFGHPELRLSLGR